MNIFFTEPNLPDKNVRLAIIGKHDQHILDFLRNQGIELIISEDNKHLDKSVANHIDLSAHHMGGDKIILDKGNDELYKILSEAGMKVFRTEGSIKSPYPDDCMLNCFIAGEYLFCNKKTTDKALLEEYSTYKIADVKQGYCKCSTLLLSNNCFITDDISVYKKGKELLFNCLLIEKGDIQLRGFEYGFIGGASAKINNSTIIFFGDITKHRSFNNIHSFITGNGMDYIYSKDFPLTDIGGIIPLK